VLDNVEVARIQTCTIPHGSYLNPAGTKHYSACMMDEAVAEAAGITRGMGWSRPSPATCRVPRRGAAVVEAHKRCGERARAGAKSFLGSHPGCHFRRASV